MKRKTIATRKENTRERRTTPSGDALDGIGEDNQANKPSKEREQAQDRG